jgi:hypothetical protein
MDLRTPAVVGEILFVSLGAIGGVGPDVAGDVVRVDQFGQ